MAKLIVSVWGSGFWVLPEDLKKLESLIHPLVRKKRKEFISHWRKQNCPLVVLDIPLLFETGQDQEVDYVIVVSAR